MANDNHKTSSPRQTFEAQFFNLTPGKNPVDKTLRPTGGLQVKITETIFNIDIFKKQ